MSEKNPSHSNLDIVENEYLDRNYKINISVPEFSCECPRTGLPDYATIDITYVPNKYIVELKSLKLYIIKFRNIGIFHEHVTNQIMDDFRLACQPRMIDVVGRFNPRGGILTEVATSWEE